MNNRAIQHIFTSFPQMMKRNQTLHIHLISDATGETTYQVARAALAQFNNVKTVEHVWTLVRSAEHLKSAEAPIKKHGGVVFFSLAEKELREKLETICRNHNVPSVSVLDHVIHTLSKLLGQPEAEVTGAQYRMDEAYFDRIEALDFTIQHDDGQGLATIGNADILLLGVSRSSKTPTSIYLAHRGYKVANYPLVPEVQIPSEVIEVKGVFVIGLINDARQLAQIRRNRLLALNEREDTDYANLKKINQEVASTRKFFEEQNWPMIDVTRRSIEETAAEIINLYSQWSEGDKS